MAERQGFEPWIEFPLYTLSKRAPSTTRPSLQFVELRANAKIQDIRQPLTNGRSPCYRWPPPLCPADMEAAPLRLLLTLLLLEKPLLAKLVVLAPGALGEPTPATPPRGALGKRFESGSRVVVELETPSRGRPIEPVPRAPPPPYQ